jgi:hypothetical protein
MFGATYASATGVVKERRGEAVGETPQLAAMPPPL